MEKEIIKKEENTPATLLDIAIEQGADLEKLEKFMELKLKWEANEAKKRYTIALSKFKQEAPVVTQDKTNKQFNSTYASKGNLIKTITPILSKFDLSANFNYKNLQSNWVEVSCKLTHSAGHFEEVSFSGPADISGAKNPIQQLKSTITYLEKLTFAGILGISSTEEQDDDGNSASEIIYITDQQLHELRDMLIAREASETKFCDYLKINDLAKLSADRFNEAVSSIKLKPAVK